MLRRLALRLCSVQTKTMSNGMKLTGKFHDSTGNLMSGVVHMPDGRVFSGTFDAAEGMPLPGSQLEDDGDLYVGSFNRQWQRSGGGEAWLADGTVYKGRFAEDELVEGIVRIPLGTEEICFEGSLRDEQFVKGTLRQSGFTYAGEFRDNAPHGSGTLTYASGAVMEGTFRAGKLHGDKCKMRLESGWVYVGSFVDGAIVSGELRTPTYTYEGSFNTKGKAHGEGTQFQLVTDPKLIFTGIWVEGQMAQGTVTDEFGTPVDWQNRLDLQQQLKEPQALAMENFAAAKIKEARQHIRNKDAEYREDVETVRRTTGATPSRTELGYDESADEVDQDALARRFASENVAEVGGRVRVAASTVDEAAEPIRRSLGEQFNPVAATEAILSQNSGNIIAAEHVRKQFQRFAAEAGTTRSNSHDATSAKLNIHANTPWANNPAL